MLSQSQTTEMKAIVTCISVLLHIYNCAADCEGRTSKYLNNKLIY